MPKPRRVLAVASGGGHWVQLFRLRKSWDGCEVTYVTTQAGFGETVAEDAAERGESIPKYKIIIEANRWQKIRLLRSLLQMCFIIIKTRPDIIITTGAAPGYFALRLGKLFGAKTVWVDSIANAQHLSLSGQKAGRYADVWMTQWPDLQAPDGPIYKGAVI